MRQSDIWFTLTYNDIQSSATEDFQTTLTDEELAEVVKKADIAWDDEIFYQIEAVLTDRH